MKKMYIAAVLLLERRCPFRRTSTPRDGRSAKSLEKPAGNYWWYPLGIQTRLPPVGS